VHDLRNPPGALAVERASTAARYVARAILGSTAENVIRRAPCDVLVVR
jgi:nucleotide-binding universal stress UspA family protein